MWFLFQDTFRSGNVLNLLSQSSEQALQLTKGSDGKPTVDGKGSADKSSGKSQWTERDQLIRVWVRHSGWKGLW